VARAQLTLLAGPAGLARRGPGAVAEFAEDLAQLVVHRGQDRRPLVEVEVIQGGQPLDGRVDPGVSGGGQSRPHLF
jgi:hypothetical protein